jgi:uncharacterized protein YjbI with pentapeptide repeats
MNEEHLKILRQGVEAWNAWRMEHPEIKPDLKRAALLPAELRGANLQTADLRGANFRGADLSGADLQEADLQEADFQGTYLRNAVFRRAFLRRADLRADLQGANLQGADLQGADLRGAHLRAANLRRSNLRGVNLRRANLQRADLKRADLKDVDFQEAGLGSTELGDVDLSVANGLERAWHAGPSTVGTNTLAKSLGRIPVAFLRGCGLSDWEIEAAHLYDPHLTEAERIDITYEIVRIQGESPIQINPLFVSYSHADAAFVEALEGQLNAKHIRFWRDVHDMKAGRIEKQIDRAMRLNPTVLLVLSENSVESDWVEWEVSQARELEKELKRDVLCPVALDEAWKNCDWPGPLRRQVEKYFILDFSAWDEQKTFEKQFDKLVKGLGISYRGRRPGGRQ